MKTLPPPSDERKRAPISSHLIKRGEATGSICSSTSAWNCCAQRDPHLFEVHPVIAMDEYVPAIPAIPARGITVPWLESTGEWRPRSQIAKDGCLRLRRRIKSRGQCNVSSKSQLQGDAFQQTVRAGADSTKEIQVTVGSCLNSRATEPNAATLLALVWPSQSP